MFLGGTGKACTEPDKECGNWAAEPVLKLLFFVLSSP